jgi:hypothetical protein
MVNGSPKTTPIRISFIISDGVGVYKTSSYCGTKPFK